jgi:hypothetical protein
MRHFGVAATGQGALVAGIDRSKFTKTREIAASATETKEVSSLDSGLPTAHWRG